MVIFHSYVSLPEGITSFALPINITWNNMSRYVGIIMTPEHLSWRDLVETCPNGPTEVANSAVLI